MNSSSTLVATVSINYEDFTEGFLTCGTCLYAYDQAEHAPKLLSCSHTICQSCLELIASSPTLNNSAEAGCIKCPICRQNIAIPNGGVGALPPSFLVNQLFDLVNKKPREFIPKCSVHIEQELLFCETCDCVFCDTCNNNNESDASSTATSLTTTVTNNSFSASIAQSIRQQQQPQNNKQHISEECTVIPFSTAIKRMSEILNYRSQQCAAKLDEARDNVQREIEKLESNCADTVRDIEVAFERIKTIIEEREKSLLEEANKLHEYKKNVLEEQLNTIENEKSKLNVNTSVKINNETDVKNLSKKISDLTEKNDTALALFTPRENCFICFENENDEALGDMQRSVDDYGKIRTSKTYPPNCTSRLVQYSTHLRSTALVQSVDYNGHDQKIGGDPIQAELKLVGCNEEIDSEIAITDRRDGTYEVAFVPPVPGEYQLYIYIFNRPIKNCPLTFRTNSHHNPIAIFGQSSKKGVADQFDHFSQPASLTINKHNGRVYIMDSFNSRIKVLAQIDSPECPFSFMHHIRADFFGRSCTGLALLYPSDDSKADEHGIQALSLSPMKTPNPSILVTDWRNRTIYELNTDGKLLNQFSHDDLVEPTNIVVDSRGRIFVVDRESIFVFNSAGKLLHKLNGYKLSSSSANRKGDDDSSVKKLDPFSDPEKLSLQSAAIYHSASQQLATIEDKENANKLTTTTNTATLNNYLISANGNDKRSNAKTNTLSSLISIRRKPKLSTTINNNSSSTLQRGSKAVISAASRIKSTFTLSHSTSLVSAASLQSMFNNSNKQNHIHQQHSFDGQSVILNDSGNLGGNNNTNNGASKPKGQKFSLQLSSQNNGAHMNANEASVRLTPTINELHQDVASGLVGANNQTSMMSASDMSSPTGGGLTDGARMEPFGIIRGIAIGPNDELVFADESRVIVLDPGEDFTLKRELLTPAGNRSTLSGVHHHHHGSANSGRLCGMTYDAHSRLLLILRTSLTTGTPYIQIVDYTSGKAKFIIDSYDSKLMRPSSLATYGQQVIVTDLGNDCIKKYRFY